MKPHALTEGEKPGLLPLPSPHDPEKLAEPASSGEPRWQQKRQLTVPPPLPPSLSCLSCEPGLEQRALVWAGLVCSRPSIITPSKLPPPPKAEDAASGLPGTATNLPRLPYGAE